MTPYISINKLGFEGSLAWVHNEEGSGALYYKSSVYFPDDLFHPVTHSGVTIDPGLDLGNASPKLCKDVIDYYASEKLLSIKQISALRDAFKLKRKEAANWMRIHRNLFKFKFLVPEKLASEVMAKYTAPKYWQPLINLMPGLLEIVPYNLKRAVHTSLLSHSYNRGAADAISLATNYLIKEDYCGLAKAIRSVKHKSQSLNERREREAYLIEKALMEDKFADDFLALNPIPLEIIREISL